MERYKVLVKFLFVAVSTILIFGIGSWRVKALVGDIDYNDWVDLLDLQTISDAFGSTESSGWPSWNPAADLNEDDKVDIKDLAIAGRNYSSQRNFHQGRYFSNAGETAYRSDSCIDGLDQIHIAWSDTTYRDVYYTRLDRYGNTLVDDVLVDSGSSTGVDVVTIGCDQNGSAHLFWDCISDVCEARYDPWGFQVVPKRIVDDRFTGVGAEADVGLDSSGRAHLFYEMHYNRAIYAMFSENGLKTVSIEEPLIANIVETRYRQLAVDQEDNVHLIWSEEDGVDRIYYAKLGADSDTSVPAIVVGYPNWEGNVTASHRPSLAVDTHGNALVLWNRSDPYLLYLDKFGADGSSLLDDYLIFPEYKSGYYQDIAVDPNDDIHLWAPTGWEYSLYLNAYGIFDEAAQPLSPMRWAMYGRKSYDPHLMIDTHGDIQLVYKLTNVTMDEPPCPINSLCYESTAFDPAAYDRSRPDLGLDVAHLSWSPTLLRWGQTLTFTTTVFNSGWTDSPSTNLEVSMLLADQTVLPPPAKTSLAIPAISPRGTQTVTGTLTLPFKPPDGYETLAYADLVTEVDPTATIVESTEDNNRVTSPVMIQPLPTTAGLFMMVKDQTHTARNGGEIPLNTGTAVIKGKPIDERAIPIKDYLTILANDLPIASTPTTYDISWAAVGYLEPDVITVTIQRNPSDPYRIDYDPSNTAIFETNTWGQLQGTITDIDTGDPILATLRIQGQGLNIQTTTDAHGHFSPGTDVKLGKLIPGTYQVYASAAQYARISGPILIPALGSQNWDHTMEPTKMAYVRGLVSNQFGRPVSNAGVHACGNTVTTESDGSFDLGEVDASCTLLDVEKSGYATESVIMALTAGLEEYFDGITLHFDPPVSVIQDEGSLTSWKQDESSDDLLPDPPNDASWFEIQIFDQFKDEFWPSYRVQVWWAVYEFYLDAAYSGPVEDRHLYDVQLRLIPKTFEAHMVSGETEVEVSGQTVKFEISAFQDSGQTTALWVIEARLVDADSGTVLRTINDPVEGGGDWIALEDTTRTYDFGGIAIDDWENAEVWIYIKAGKNEGGAWHSSNILEGWYFDKQVLRFDLNEASAISDYVIVNFPIP